jgi:hypothetical protein
MRRFRNARLAKMSSGHYCVIRDLGLVKGGKGLRHHEVVLDLSLRGLGRGLGRVLGRGAFKFAKSMFGSRPEESGQESASEPVLATQATRARRG